MLDTVAIQSPPAPASLVAVRDANSPLYTAAEMDSLHILPLAVVPLQTRGLQRANLVKNSRLRSVVQLFSGEQTGSGQIEIADLGLQFGTLRNGQHPDIALLKKLGELRSYDVYSLRITLRETGIPLSPHGMLKLSNAKEAELAGFMRRFTKSLLKETFAPAPSPEDDDSLELVVIEDDDATRGLLNLINPGAPKTVYENLANFADRLEIKVNELPRFLEDFADIHLSIAYFENCYAGVIKDYERFSAIVSGLKKSNKTFRDNQVLQQKCERIDYAMTTANSFIREQLMLFDVQTHDFWNNISANRFREMEKIVKNNHVRLGGILCGMTVKMDSWSKKFPSPEKANPSRVAEFVMYELAEGVGNIFDAVPNGK